MPTRKFGAIALCLLAGLTSPGVPAHALGFEILYNFKDQSDGGEPLGGVVEDQSGNLYGETYRAGGATCTTSYSANIGCGTVYRLSAAGGFTVLANFTGPNGAHGNITPALIGHTLYATTVDGGTSDDGVVFALNTSGTGFTLLHQFAGTDGSFPQALVAGPNGVLYGVAQTGGPADEGVLFSLTTAGVFTVLHNFSLPNGGNPKTLIVASNGTLVGSTLVGGKSSSGCKSGCGTVFSYVPATGTFTTLYTYAGTGGGYYPYVGSVGPGPTVYGADFDFIFSLTSGAGYTPLVGLNFYTTGEGVESGPLYTPGGTLYGVLGGSVSAADGLIYSVTKGVFQELYVFSGSVGIRDGSGPAAQPIFTRSKQLVGTNTANGDCLYCGTVWEYTP